VSDQVVAGAGIRRHFMADKTFAEGMVARLGVTLVQVPAQIAQLGTESGLIDCGAGYPVAIYGPAGWTAAALGFQQTLDGGNNWRTMRDFYRDYTVDNFGPNAYLLLPPQDFHSVRQFRLTSSIQQAAARDFIVLVAP
jgi:hypothetical protein